MVNKGRSTTMCLGVGSFCIFVCFLGYVFFPSININLALNPFFAAAAKGPPMFYGENIDMSQILPASQHYVVNSKGQDLIDIAADLGVNFVRITNAKRSFENNTDSVYTRAQWDQVLNKMQRKGIKALILIETASNNAAYYTPDIRPVYLHLVQEYIDSGVFAHPDVYAVDIKNEPVLTAANLRMLQTAHAMIKKKYPHLKQTVGWWAGTTSSSDPYNPTNYDWEDFSAGQQLAGIVDFYSIHMYALAPGQSAIALSPDLKTKLFVSQAENGLQTKKPILIEEFGEANGDAVSDQDTIGSPQLQANVYQGVYQALQEMGSSQILGAVAFDFYSRDEYPDAWAIVKDHGNYLFPAAYVLQSYALGKRNPALQTLITVTSQSYLLRNAGNHTTQNLRVSDRIGLKLQLVRNKKYTLALNVHGIVKPLEPFHYDPVAGSYDAVYQAVGEGTTRLNVCDVRSVTNAACASPAYTLTINVRS